MGGINFDNCRRFFSFKGVMLIFKEFIPFTKSSGNPAFQVTFINYDKTVQKAENIDYCEIIKEQTDIYV